MGQALSRPAFGRIKHVLSEEGKPDASPNIRYHYNLLDHLHKRRGGGGASELSGDSSADSGKLDGRQP